MSQELRYLIRKIERTRTTTGKTVVNLYGDPRLKFPVLVLFNLTELAKVGIDPNSLEHNEERFVTFWAYYQVSDKLNKDKNAYKDVLYLAPAENTDIPAAPDTEKILDALRIIYTEIRAIRAALETDGKPSDDQGQGSCAAAPTPDPSTPDASPAPTTLPDEIVNALTYNDARATFYALAGPALAKHRLTPSTVNNLAQQANQPGGWQKALQQLNAMLQNHTPA